MTRKIQVIINPGSGQPKPVLHTINQIFRPAGVEWDLALTHKSGDAERFARDAVKEVWMSLRRMAVMVQ